MSFRGLTPADDSVTIHIRYQRYPSKGNDDMTQTRVPKAYRSAVTRVPAEVRAGHSVANVGDDEVVVFLIGARVHRWRRVRSWMPTVVAMTRMLRQLANNPDVGLLAAQPYFSGRNVIVVQYWRSVEDLGRFAKNPALAHLPAWSEFNAAAAGSGDIGIWHETYRVGPDQIETRYANMAPFGLAKALGVQNRRDSPRNQTHELMDETVSEYLN